KIRRVLGREVLRLKSQSHVEFGDDAWKSSRGRNTFSGTYGSRKCSKIRDYKEEKSCAVMLK
ncbi:unnamed protein product, partial [Musa textilis]